MDFFSVVLGPIFGLVGTLGGRALDIKAKKQDYEHEMKKFEHEVNMRAQERIAKQEENEQAMELNSALTESDIAKTIVTGSYDGLKASLEADASYKPSQWVENIRTLIRPGLTVGLGLVTAALAWTMTADVQATVVSSIISQFMLASTWWFGDRPSGQFQTKWQK